MVFRWADCVEHRRRLTVFDLTDSLVKFEPRPSATRDENHSSADRRTSPTFRSSPPISGAVETLAESTVQSAIERESWIAAHREKPDDD